jgi:branched-chain amino acid transport system ATP-binding protein
MASESLFSARGIEAGYGRVQVLWGAGLAVREHQTVALLGPNGAGKTTLLKVLSGLIRPWRGEIRFEGRDITLERTDKRVRAGLAYMSEIGSFPGLSVEENIRIGGQFTPAALLKERMAELYRTFPAIAERRRGLAGSLSGGQRKMLAIAKALAGSPRLLLMDEPSAGLSPLFVNEVLEVMRRFRGEGLSLLIAEQNVRFLDLADRVYILDGGRIGFEGTVAELNANDALHRAYFGLK